MNEYHLQQCNIFIEELMRSPMTMELRTPVDPVKDKVPDYPKIVKNPMDLGTIKKNLKNGVYTSVDAFYNDIKLVCDNAKLFNGAETMLGFVADDIMKMADEWRNGLSSCMEEEWFKEQEKGLILLQKHLKNAPPCITNEPEIEIPEAVNVAKLSKQTKSKIAEMIKPFDVNNLENVWAFVDNEKRKEIIKLF